MLLEPAFSGAAAIKFEPPTAPSTEASRVENYQPPADRPIRIYCDGIYDLFHYGHARSLEQAKKLFPWVHLIVGVCNDELTLSKKGKFVLSQVERAESLRHCRWVDEIIENAPWEIDQAFLDEHQIDFVAHDDIPYASGSSADVYHYVKEQGHFLATQRTAGISTSDLITRIICDYDVYIRRNLSRGFSAQKLNLSLLKRGELQMRQALEEWKSRFNAGEENIRRNWEATLEEMSEAITSWEHRSQQLTRDFVDLFKNPSKALKHFLSASKPRPQASDESDVELSLEEDDCVIASSAPNAAA